MSVVDPYFASKLSGHDVTLTSFAANHGRYEIFICTCRVKLITRRDLKFRVDSVISLADIKTKTGWEAKYIPPPIWRGLMTAFSYTFIDCWFCLTSNWELDKIRISTERVPIGTYNKNY